VALEEKARELEAAELASDEKGRLAAEAKATYHHHAWLERVALSAAQEKGKEAESARAAADEKAREAAQAHAAIDDESIELQDEAEEAADKPPAAAEADGGAPLPPPLAPKPTSALAKSIAEGW